MHVLYTVVNSEAMFCLFLLSGSARTLSDWFYGLSDHLIFLFCSTAGFVCTVWE